MTTPIVQPRSWNHRHLLQTPRPYLRRRPNGINEGNRRANRTGEKSGGFGGNRQKQGKEKKRGEKRKGKTTENKTNEETEDRHMTGCHRVSRYISFLTTQALLVPIHAGNLHDTFSCYLPRHISPSAAQRVPVIVAIGGTLHSLLDAKRKCPGTSFKLQASSFSLTLRTTRGTGVGRILNCVAVTPTDESHGLSLYALHGALSKRLFCLA